MNTLHGRLSQQTLASLVVTLGLAACGRGDKHAPSATHALAPNQLATPVMPALANDEDQGGRQHPPTASARGRRSSYRVVLTWCFTFFSTARVLAYLPTVMSIVEHGDSTQHSLWTWLTWLGANVTMAAWLFEHNGAGMNRAIAVSVANAGMCFATAAVIVAYRL